LIALSAMMLVAMGFFIGTGVIDHFVRSGDEPVVGVIAEDNRVGVSQPADADDAAALQPEAIALPDQEITAGAGGLTALEQQYAQVFTDVSPSVVAISVVTAFGEGSGSGFVIDTQGHIVTNYHVVGDAGEIVVNFLDGTITRAEIVGLDPNSDLAVIRVDPSITAMRPVTFGSIDALVVGQITLAIGSPFGERWTMTTGIISALNRTIPGLTSYSIGAAIQTDAAINPGNSGGPLMNLAGEVIGVNAQILTQSGQSAGVGFAIPADLAQRVALELIATGEVNYSYIGIGVDPITNGDVTLAVIESLALPNDLRGVVVGEVIPGGPAEQAGLRNSQVTQAFELVEADIITAINGEPIRGWNDLVSYLARSTQPGDQITLTIYRNGETIELSLTLAERPNA
jgi:S1-C subfamily serine protease